MTRMMSWVRLPTRWIQDGGLTALKWTQGIGSTNVAALLVLPVIAHNADNKGTAERVTYNDLETATGLSRTKISNGLTRLYDLNLVRKDTEQQSRYHLLGFDPTKGWGKLPASGLYQRGRIPAFHDFKLRKNTELDALKLYYAVVAFRDNNSNISRMSYPTVERYTGIPRNKIRSAISFLVANELMHVDLNRSEESEFRVYNAYRLAHLDTRKHTGTKGRSDLD